MNVDTGAIYRTQEEIDAARARGENLVSFGPDQLEQLDAQFERERSTRVFELKADLSSFRDQTAVVGETSYRKLQRLAKAASYHDRLMQKQREFCESMNAV